MVKKKRIGSTTVLKTPRGDIIISAVDVLRWNSKYRYEGKTYKVSDLVTRAKKSKNPHTVSVAKMIEKDTKGEKGLLIGFPMAFLVDDLKKQGLLDRKKLKKVM